MALLKPLSAPVSQKFGGHFEYEPIGWYRNAADGRALKAYGSWFPGSSKSLHFHKGLDIYATKGTPIVASENGTVASRGTDGTGAKFIRVLIQGHTNTFYTSIHCDGFATGTSTGATVKRGQVIAYIGMTGKATGPHNHFMVEFMEKGSDGVTRRMAYDPCRFMPAGSYRMGTPYGGLILPGGDMVNDDRIYPIHTVTISAGVNVRSTPYVIPTNIVTKTSVATPVAQLNEVLGGSWTVNGVTKNTWAKLYLNSQVVYVATALIK